ncbi:GDSL-type esterase/lipase family protein [Planococcus shenhongbingii]|uniref:GDSL-type esterase/lipase family protein n=1 Tax=Planococcus shenhongbingii TaxID=3058398 RepID=UPI00261BF39E|nr:GDSL-type esterase/lipase family protein [Planococcus sp. N016]WKA56885.1 GDSL-type esterase/lipase family protein [Planococcus sp. N016]
MKTNSQPGALLTGAPFSNPKKQKKMLYLNHIVLLGDSVAYGYGTQGGIAKYLKETFQNSQVTNLGINGLTSNGMVERLRSGIWDKTIASADMVLINIGGNDLLHGFRGYGAKGLVRQFSSIKRTFRQNLLETYKRIRELNEAILIVQNNLYNSMKKEVQYFGFTDLLLRLWNSSIGEKDVIVSRTEIMGKNPEIWLDAIHPNDAGYKLMHELLMKTLSSTGIIINSPERADRS